MPSKDAQQRLSDIIEFAERVTRYVAGRDQQAFLADDMARDGIGNPLRHEYDTIEDHLIWEAVRGCPSLAEDCRRALQEPKD